MIFEADVPLKQQTTITSKRRKVFHCDSCGKEYSSEACYQNHLQLHDQELKAMKRLAVKNETPSSNEATRNTSSISKRPRRNAPRPKRFETDGDENLDELNYQDSNFKDLVKKSSKG